MPFLMNLILNQICVKAFRYLIIPVSGGRTNITGSHSELCLISKALVM